MFKCGHIVFGGADGGVRKGKEPKLEREVKMSFSQVIRFGAFAYVIQQHVGNSTLAVGASMEPTLHSRGDVLVAEYVRGRLFGRKLRRGDMVVAIKPTDSRTRVVKRVQAVAGDLIYGKRVQMNHVWLAGDNTNCSTDSRHYGAVPCALIQGTVYMRVWPLQHVARATRMTPPEAFWKEVNNCAMQSSSPSPP